MFPRRVRALGDVAFLTSTNLTTILSPQRKVLRPKKRVMVHSPHRSTVNEVALSMEASSSGSSTFGSDQYNQNSLPGLESSSSLCSASSGHRARAVFSGGQRHAQSGGGRGGHGLHPPHSRYADPSDKSLSSAVGSDSSSSRSSSK
jgi:hypothetical protein